jgi:threonine dehydratase
VDAVLEYGAEIVSCGNDPRERIRVAEETAKAHPGCFLLPSYDHPDVMSGQGTLMLEFLSQVDDGPLDAIIVPVGGGGLLSGCCLAAKGTQCIRIFAAEPRNADDAAQSHRSGTLVEPSSPPNTIADGLRTGLGIHTWPVIRDMVEEVLVCDTQKIIK